MAFAKGNGYDGACVFIMNGKQAAIPTIETQGSKSFLTAWEPIEITGPNDPQCIEAHETFRVETTAAEINTLIGQEISEL